MIGMILRTQLLEAPHLDTLNASIEKFLEQNGSPSLATAHKNKTLTIQVSHSETVGGWGKPEPRYIAVISWPDIL